MADVTNGTSICNGVQQHCRCHKNLLRPPRVCPSPKEKKAPILPTPAPTLPSPAPTLPSPAPTLPSPASTLPSPASTLPSPASTLPSPASTLPCPSSILPCPASTLPCPSSILPCPASTLPCPAPILPCPASTLPCPAPILPPAVQQVIRTLTSAGPAIQAWENELLLPLIRRQLAASCDGQTVSCKTGGQEQAIEDLTSAAKQAAEKIVTQFEAFPLDLVTRSNGIRVKYETIFKAFAKCHKGYSHTNSMTNDEISNLDCSIKHFLAKYRELFPTSSVSVKMHLLEEHVIPWIRCWGVGLGFHGEQGVEQVHAVFNRINRSTSSIPDAVRRLKSTLETHLLQVHPGRQDGVPAPKKRRRNVQM
ncbi:uncharacterized protein LOC144904748 [Branchiostoma floridae x Branchiostoma belcheri]